jgi:hypothetical protein
MQKERGEEGGNMKKHCFLITALLLVFAGAASAQQLSDPKLKSDVPFDFVVNGTTLPAGAYVVRTYSTGHALVIQNQDNPEYAAIVSNNNMTVGPYKTHNGATLVFSLNNGQHVLHQIRLEGDNHTHDIIHGNDVAELVASR